MLATLGGARQATYLKIPKLRFEDTHFQRLAIVKTNQGQSTHS